MKLSGDNEGIEVLKKFKDVKPEYLKFLIKSAQTNFDRKAEFKDEQGNKFLLKYDPLKKEFTVEKA